MHMNKSSVTLSEFLSDALPGDDLPAAIRAAIARAFSAVRSHAHRSAARRARGSELIERVRILITANDTWKTELSLIECNVIDVKFGSGGPELSNTEVGETLNLTKQMIAYHLKSIAQKLETKFGTAAELVTAASAAAATGSEQGLMRDERWRAIVDWWQARQKDKKELSKEDLEFLSELVERVGDIESGAAESETTAVAAGKPGRRLPPTRYQDLRSKLIESPGLLDRLTQGQKNAMRIGLALGENELVPGAELGFRRFDESEKMTKQNFNYMVREVIKRLQPEEINPAD